jgi:hypothetical protein
MAMKNTTRAELAANIKQHRWLVFHIMEGNETEPAFTYTVGLFETFGHPEVVIFGVKQEAATGILNEIGEGASQGLKREAGVLYDDVLEGYSCAFKPVSLQKYEAYFGWALVFYGEHTFPMLQCVWPDARKRFPGDTGYTLSTQEVLFEQ